MSRSKNAETDTLLSRRKMLKLTAAGAAGLTVLKRVGDARALPKNDFLDLTAIERIADRDAGVHPPLVIDVQTHVWWRSGGVAKMNPAGEAFLKGMAGFRANYTGRPVPIADMGRVMFFDDLFLKSETDIAFLNSFGMKGAYDGVDLFPPREAALIRSMAPARVRVLGCVDPPDGQSAVESLIYQCETLKIDGLKLYPPGMDARGWLMDDEKNTYPLYEVLRKHGVKNICVHKGIPGAFIEKYCHPLDMTRAAADFPDLNFIAFHSAFPYDAELAEQAKKAKVKNIYAELGALAQLMVNDPQRFAQLVGRLLDALDEDHIFWGTDTPIFGPPHWAIQAFQAFTIPDEMIEKNKYPRLTAAVKEKIMCHNAARAFKIDIKSAKKAIENDVLYKLRQDGNPLPVTVDTSKLRGR
jgi:uncharacterized protein